MSPKMVTCALDSPDQPGIWTIIEHFGFSSTFLVGTAKDDNLKIGNPEPSLTKSTSDPNG